MEIQRPGPERLRDGDSPGDANRTSLIEGLPGAQRWRATMGRKQAS
jgi:hypothetical protein